MGASIPLCRRLHHSIPTGECAHLASFYPPVVAMQAFPHRSTRGRVMRAWLATVIPRLGTLTAAAAASPCVQQMRHAASNPANTRAAIAPRASFRLISVCLFARIVPLGSTRNVRERLFARRTHRGPICPIRRSSLSRALREGIRIRWHRARRARHALPGPPQRRPAALHAERVPRACTQTSPQRSNACPAVLDVQQIRSHRLRVGSVQRDGTQISLRR